MRRQGEAEAALSRWRPARLRRWAALGVAVGLLMVMALASRPVADAGFQSPDGSGDLRSEVVPPMQADAVTPTRPAVRVTAGPPPGGQPLPPTIPPVGQPARPGSQTLPPTIPPAGQLPGAYPAQPGAPPTTAPRPPAAATPLPAATSGVNATAAATASARPTGTGATPTTTAAPGAPAFLTLSGRIAQRDGASFVVAIPGRGTVTVSPGPDTEVRRDNAPSSAASLAVGDNVTLEVRLHK